MYTFDEKNRSCKISRYCTCKEPYSPPHSKQPLMAMNSLGRGAGLWCRISCVSFQVEMPRHELTSLTIKKRYLLTINAAPGLFHQTAADTTVGLKDYGPGWPILWKW